MSTTPRPREVAVHGYAIVSADDCIADAAGNLPPALMNDADWAYFQGELDRCALVVLGRSSHEATPNARGRRRLVLSRAVPDLVERSDAWWWNPDRLAWAEVCARLLPEGGMVGVPGGQGVFDLFLRLGFAGFHLSRSTRVVLPGGQAVFSGVEQGRPAEAILADAGLRPDPMRWLDEPAGVSFTVFRASSHSA